jgi:hypothetical protein
MDNEITCPNCQRKITRNPIVEDAAEGVGSDNQFLICECGERITCWQITAPLGKQKTLGMKFHTMFQGLFQGRG